MPDPVEISEIINQRLSNPDAAFAYLLSFFQADSKRNIQENINIPNAKESSALNKWGTAINNIEKLYSAIKDYASIASESEYVLVLGFNHIFEEALNATVLLAQELIVDILRDETGRNTTIQYGSGSAWGNKKDQVVEVAQKLFELQEIKRLWEDTRKLKRERRSD